MNDITLQISGDVALDVAAGTPVEESKAAGSTGTLFYLHLKNLELSPSELNGLAVTLDGWITKVYADTQTICLTPASDMQLIAGQVLTASIANFIAGKAPSGGGTALHEFLSRESRLAWRPAVHLQQRGRTVQPPPSGKLDTRIPPSR